MKRLLLILSAAFVYQSMAQKMTRFSLDFKVSQTDFVDSIRIEWDHNQVYVPVSIGNETYRFLLDTGSGQAVVYDNTPIEGCRPIGHILSYDAIGRRDTVELVALPPMTIGTLTFTGCQATMQHRAVRRKDFDGIVGFDIIAMGLNAKIDVRDSVLILSDRKNFFESESGFNTRYKLDYHVPHVEVSPFGNFKELALFDTGSRQFYAINKKNYDEGIDGADGMLGVQIHCITEGRYAIGNFGAEPEGEVAFLRLDAMKWGDFLFSKVETMTTQGGSHLGADILNYGAVVFNPKRKRMKFQPYNGMDTCHVNNKTLEIAYVSDHGRPAVGIVREGSVPYRQGFRSGDIILAIDGKSVSTFDAFRAFAYDRGREHLFKVIDKEGREKEVRWVRLPRLQYKAKPQK